MYPVLSASRAGGGGINSIPPPIRPPLLPNVFNEVEEEDEEDESAAFLRKSRGFTVGFDPGAKGRFSPIGVAFAFPVACCLWPVAYSSPNVYAGCSRVAPSRTVSSVPLCARSALCGKKTPGLVLLLGVFLEIVTLGSNVLAITVLSTTPSLASEIKRLSRDKKECIGSIRDKDLLIFQQPSRKYGSRICVRICYGVGLSGVQRPCLPVEAKSSDCSGTREESIGQSGTKIS